MVRGVTLSPRAAPIVALVASLAGLAFAWSAAPTLFERGFPLDDSWIHAVYARELARSFTLAYNPGVPATGATSLLWPVLLAPLFALTASTPAFVVATKALGFLLHAGAAALFAYAFASRPGSSEARDRRVLEGIAAGLLVALNPDLLAASLSGMEVALAELVLAAVVLAVRFERRALHALLALVAFLARPELVLVAVLVVALAAAGRGPRAMLTASLAPAGGALAGLAASSIRNLSVSGLPLPAPFYVKVGADTSGLIDPVVSGFSGLMGTLGVAGFWPLWPLAGIAALWLIVRAFRAGRGVVPLAAAAALSALAFVVASFLLVSPDDPDAFYHQRYVLPGFALFLASFPALVMDCVASVVEAARARLAVLGMLTFGALVTFGLDLPTRIVRLDNDSHNIDDVQVRLGQRLAEVGPEAVIWTVDAGAVRYFARGDVVDSDRSQHPRDARSRA